MRRGLMIIISILVIKGVAVADREPSPFEGTYNVTRTNLATGEKFSEELRISWFGGYYLFEDIQGGDGGELLEQEGIEYSGWMAAGSIEYGGTVGLYRMDGQGITGIELFVPDTTFYVIKSEEAEPLELKKQWARGRYRSFFCIEGDDAYFESTTELTGDSELWVMVDSLLEGEGAKLTSCGLSSGNGVAMLFEDRDWMTLSVYTITGGNLEGRWFSSHYTEEYGLIWDTGTEELIVEKIYE